MNLVMDSSALIALLRGEPGGELIPPFVDEPSNECYIHAINLCEVYYGFRRETGDQNALRVLEAIRAMPIIVREDMDTDFWLSAGCYKADLRRVSLADCFCMVLANRLDAELVTADRQEFGPAAEQRLCRVRFVR